MGPESAAVGNNTGLMTISNFEQASHGPQQAIQMEPSPPYMASPKKGERSRSGCITCRARKVKCDERPRGRQVESIASPQSRQNGIVPLQYQNGTVSKSLPLSREEPESNAFVAVDVQSPNAHDGTLDARGAELPAWLFSSSLPSKEIIYQLVDNYFTNIHPLRCYSFIHRPSFMERLDQDPAITNMMSGPLLHVICALGAKFYALETLNYEKEIDTKSVLASGSQWADIAQRQVFGNMNNISVENLMAAVLVYEHELRVGNYSGAFMISGAATRMLQALQINLEYSTDILCTKTSNTMPFCTRESRRRLMWSCYVADSWVGSGVDQLTLIADCDVKVQLPCHERNFIQQIPSITETLTKGQVLNFIPQELRPRDPSINMGIAAYFARIAGIRKKILRYIKQVDLTKPLQLPDAGFSSLETSCEDWLNSLPPALRLTTASIYTRKDSSQLGALFLLHCAYHITLCDLYRITMPVLLPGLLRTRLSVELTPDQQTFRALYQRKCFEHSRDAAGILMKAVSHGAKFLADTWLCTCAFESTRTMLYYSVQGVDRNRGNSRELVLETVPFFQANMKAMRLMIPLFATAERCYTAATSLMRKAGIGPHLVEGAPGTDEELKSSDIERPVDYSNPPGETPENVLNPLSIYALTRQNIDEKESVASGNSLYSTRVENTTQTPAVPTDSLRQKAHDTSLAAPQQQLPSSVSQAHYNAASDEFMPNMALMWEQQDLGAGIDQFWPGFMPDFDGLWLPADTAQENMSAMGMPTWVPGLPDETFEGDAAVHHGPIRPTPSQSG
ncbi:hypothetical protein V490_08281 [Pseudogymnoascus sp. VKM F-3557]|nr:hypothetical protein V490_08281 [Pseudogymnoascus sp. VKM F-3557]